ncbi:MAG: MucR family transcriptional regulator [Alphaproteobacteria bacterium]|nr:MucR family transcriptional regulator [Alphaproteobacteria bacterium]
MIELNESFAFLAMTSEIVAAYVSSHKMEPQELPAFIQLVHHSLCHTNEKSSFYFSTAKEPAVSIEDSITPDHLICLEDGKLKKMLKRHLKTTYNLTPDQYRERWGLPSNYPMVAPNYAKTRSSIAKNIGLGSHKKDKKKVAA